jgi:ribosome-associated heat shock protein Hsp15
MGNKVTALLDHRVQYSEAIKYYTDITPPEELDRIKFQAAVFHTGKRLSKVGRPTKKINGTSMDLWKNAPNP